MAQLLAETEGVLLLELLDSELNPSEQRRSEGRSRTTWTSEKSSDVPRCTSESWKVRDMCRHLEWGQILTTTPSKPSKRTYDKSISPELPLPKSSSNQTTDVFAFNRQWWSISDLPPALL